MTNCLIKPFTMYAIASFFFYVVFTIPTQIAKEYLARAALLDAAPCTAMVYVWSSLTNGNPTYTLLQVATNDFIILIAFVPIVALLLGMGNVTAACDT